MRLPPPRLTLGLIGVTAGAWVLATLLGLGDLLALKGGFIPARVAGAVVPEGVPAWLTPLSATLLHGGILHLGFNMLMLGYCGRFVEFALGWKGALLVYAAGAYGAALAQYAWAPVSMVPMIGASGAISATVGAYALMFGERPEPGAGRRRGHWGHWRQVLRLAGGWMLVQALVGIASAGSGVSIAIAAHVGGFIAGLLLARPLLRWRYRKA